MILCIDCGNTRLKWAIRDGSHWRADGVLTYSDLSPLSALVQRYPAMEQIAIANVAGPGVAEALEQALAGFPGHLHFLKTSASAAGVTNGYAEPTRLGVDRWCALVGAHALHPGATIVVSAGTATTIDTLDAQGNFRGGFILPGLELMRTALARNTAQLPLAAGAHQPYPRCTDDAISSGVVEATVGAIERAFARIAGHADARCLLTGGAAPLLQTHLDMPHEWVEKLVLEGVFRLARQTLC